MDKNLVKTDEVHRALSEAGFDAETEMLDLESSGNGFEIPRIRIEHKDNGKHRIYIDYGESYVSDDTQEETLTGQTFQAVIFAEQNIRALWQEGEALPVCSGINGSPMTPKPVSDNCSECPEAVIGQGKCRPKVRLLVLLEKEGKILPYVMNLSPTSIKNWSQHKRKLKRSNLPVVAVNTVFRLEDTKKNSYRWALVDFDVNGVASKEVLLVAKQARDELDRVMQDVTAKDFEDHGDQPSN